jgi:hypothetical protein
MKEASMASFIYSRVLVEGGALHHLKSIAKLVGQNPPSPPLSKGEREETILVAFFLRILSSLSAVNLEP